MLQAEAEHSVPIDAGHLEHEVPMLMGVSAPVLKYVVFCPQEDASWPLAQGREQSSRYDEIFGVAKYAKAMQLLRDKARALENDFRTAEEVVRGARL